MQSGDHPGLTRPEAAPAAKHEVVRTHTVLDGMGRDIYLAASCRFDLGGLF